MGASFLPDASFLNEAFHGATARAGFSAIAAPAPGLAATAQIVVETKIPTAKTSAALRARRGGQQRGGIKLLMEDTVK